MSSEDNEVKLTSHNLVRKQCACGWAVYARTEAAAKACILDHQERYHTKRPREEEQGPSGEG